MPIPENQLETWAKQGATVASADAYKSIQAALNAHHWPHSLRYQVFLQGSYANATNIRADSDVDVVVQLVSSPVDSVGDPLASGRLAVPPTREFRSFREEVVAALRGYYGHFHVSSGTRSLKVEAAPRSGGLAVDVVPCVQLRRYRGYISSGEAFIEGMAFEEDSLFSPAWIVNYPKAHKDNGADKNSQNRTRGAYRSTCRVFKNAKKTFIRKNWWDDLEAPSYFVECLLYQAPDSLFGRKRQATFTSVLDWLRDALHRESLTSRMLCQNQQTPLFGMRSDQWSVAEAEVFVDSMAKLWRSW